MKAFHVPVHRCLYLAVVNYCNAPKLTATFQQLIDTGVVEYYFIQGEKCKKFLTSIICERNSIWTRGEKLLLNVAPFEAIKMLPDIGDSCAKLIVDVRGNGQLGSINELIKSLEEKTKLSTKIKTSITRHFIC